MGALITGTQVFSFDTLAQMSGEAVARMQEHERSALLFCLRWLRGDEAFEFHTSGSTGIPKKITASRQRMQASAEGTIAALGLDNDEHIYLCLDARVIGGAMMLLRAMLLGCTITVVPPSSDPLAQLAEDHAYTFASFVPLQLQALLQDDAAAVHKLNRFRHILVGGAAIPQALEDKIAALHAACYHTYGMTETLSHIALRRIGADNAFTVLPGVEISTDARGCLQIKAPVTGNEWISTNDVAEIISPQKFRIEGRIDDRINSGGLKFFAGRIEALIREALQPAHMNVLVGAVPDDVLGEKIVAVLETGEPEKIDQENLRQYISSRLSKHAVPKIFYSCRRFELTASGKVDKLATLKKVIS